MGSDLVECMSPLLAHGVSGYGIILPSQSVAIRVTADISPSLIPVRRLIPKRTLACRHAFFPKPNDEIAGRGNIPDSADALAGI